MRAKVSRTQIAHAGTSFSMLGRLSLPTRSAMALPYSQVDVAAQSRSYKLALRGAEDGARNDPTAAADLEALSEQEVMTAIDAERDRCLVDLAAQLRAGRDALAQLQTAMDIAALRAAADEADADFDLTKTIFANTLHEHRRRAQAAGVEADDFRARHALTRNVRLPANRGLSWAITTLLVVVEGAFNAFSFASASDLGLLGGAVIAIIFSTVNVAVGVLNGWFPLRWANHRNMAIKLTGLVAFPALCIASIILNGFVAHYRDVSQAAPDTAPLFEAFAATMRDPFGLQSIES